MLERVIGGGQTGSDQAGWRAAKACGIATGGYMPLGFLTEDGPRPEFAKLYGAVELPTADYAKRTRRNVLESSATIWFGSMDTPGSATTHRACLDHVRSCLDHVRSCLDVVEGLTRPSDVVRWLGMNGFRALNVAGNRESSNPGIGEKTERFLMTVFRRLAEG